jgi:hypothetical protein
MTIDELFDRRIPLAIVAALLLQGSAVVWWAASKDSDDRFQQQRIEHLEQTVSEENNAQTEMLERLARIEERVNAEMSVLDRIEKQMGTLHR